MAGNNEVVTRDGRVVQKVVYAFIVIMILAFVGGIPAYLALGQGGSETATVTVTAQPVSSSPATWSWGGEPGCPAGEVSTAGRITGAGSVIQSFVVKSFDKRFSLTIDEGTTTLTPDGTCPRCIGIHEMESSPSLLASLPERAHIIGVMYDAAPNEATFDPPATLRYSYDPAAIPEGISEESLVIACYDEASGEWTELDSVVDTEANTITAKISRFNDLAVLGYEVVAPAAFEVSSLNISPDEVDISKTVNVTVLVANIGGQPGSYKVILKINGVAEADREVAINAGASKQVSFSIARDTAGIYSVDVNGLTGSFEVKPKPAPVTPVEPTPAKLTNWWLIGGISAAVVVVGSIIYLFFMRRRY